MQLITSGGVMNSIFLGLITLAFLVLVGFVIYFLYELKKTLISLRQHMATSEETLKSTTEELQMTLRSVRKITDDVGTVTDDVKEFSGSIRQIGENVKQISSVVGMVTTTSFIQVSGIKAGIKAGFGYFLKNILAKR
ncbi:MAG: hypothetical protein C0399_05650 [Syntrophus sp. (in: bacteria)]|nr:hypothetical protein [Syntrophus sp. (in: bacteria)]